ncbi:MAG: peptidase M48, partial [Gemmatimonadota bacterium]|nr:peptidase M48 [Gemmatimonadota bacterium]
MTESDPENGDNQENGNGEDGQDARATRILTDIAPRAWEHPADRAALAALRKIPVFDDVLRA